MLKRGLLLVTWLMAHAAYAQDEASSLRRPEQLTIGLGDQFLGQLSPDEKSLYFVSNRDTRKEIYVQEGEEGRLRTLFDEGADVTWPRVSPDGKSLLYISFSERAAGQLCIRTLPDAAERRCLEHAPAALQAEWVDAQRITLVARTSIDGDLRLFEVRVGSKLEVRPLFDRNWTSPSLSPDGRWLVYVPLDRVTKTVGPGFAARAAQRLEAVRLDSLSEPVPLEIDLPGMTGQPAFARDGKSLYFVQFFSDSNRDGVIDASDHGVLFRVPFPSQEDDAPAQAKTAAPLQITDTSWNCQYPAPARSQLVATCARRRKLDIFGLPLDGAIPSDWSAERLRIELSLVTNNAQQLMLYRYALAQTDNPSWQRLLTMRLVMGHLALDEFDAAEFYAHKVKALRDPATRGIGRPLLALVEQRRARNDQERGRSVGNFTEEARARLSRLEDGPKDSPATRALNRVVRSEIADALGDKGEAKRELELTQLDEDVPRSVIEIYFARADALYRQLDDRGALVTLARKLANRSALPDDARLDYARAAVRALVRGLPWDEATQLLSRERESEFGSPAEVSTAQESELAFAFDLGRLTLAIRDGRPKPEVKAALLSLYDAQTRADRKRAVILDALQRAAEFGADGLLEALSERYLDDVAQGTGEWLQAERVYRRAIMGRAYRRLAREKLAEARADFDEVSRRTGSLEALVGGIDVRLREGKSREIIAREMAQLATAEGRLAFVQAYLLAHALARLSAEPYAQTVSQIRTFLRGAWPFLKDEGAARTLVAALLHEDYRRTSALASAESANFHYLVALELVRNDPRYRARVLTQLGLLHAQVGNYRIAAGYLQQRAKLPFNEDAEALSVHLTTARALLHVSEEEQAAAATEEALTLLARAPDLAPFRLLSLERAGLAHLSAKQFGPALARYDEALHLLPDDDSPVTRRNRFVLRLSHAAMLLGANQAARALTCLAWLETQLKSESQQQVLASRYVPQSQAVNSYRALISGLSANAHRALGQNQAAQAALIQHHQALVERFALSNREDDLRALVVVESRLVDSERARGNTPEAMTWLQRALERATQLTARTGDAVDVDLLRLLWLGAELQARGAAALGLDLSTRLSEARNALFAGTKSQRAYANWFEIYLALSEARQKAEATTGP